MKSAFEFPPSDPIKISKIILKFVAELRGTMV